LITIITGLVLYSAFIHKKNNDKEIYYRKYNKYVKKLIGQKISLTEFMKTTEIDRGVIIVLYYKYDCSNCIMECFRQLNELSKIKLQKCVFTDSDYNNDTKLYGIDKTTNVIIYNDKNKNIKKMFKNVNIPVIIFMYENEIKSIIFPTTFLPEEQKNNFWKSINFYNTMIK